MENLGWGLQMMALGMGLVFGLLALLWGLLTLVLKFERQADGSWLSAGTNAKTDLYEFQVRTGPTPAATLWLEALADDTLGCGFRSCAL